MIRVLCLCGILVWAGCLGIWWATPALTGAYTADYTREFFVRLPWLQQLALPNGSVADVGGMVGWLDLGLAVMTAGYLAGLLVLRSRDLAGGLATWVVVGFALVFRATFLLLPGLFSTDVFSYVMYGRIAAVYGQNPYVRAPAEFPNDAFVSWVFPFWRETPTVYGPVWTDVSWLVSAVTGGLAAFDQVLAYRLGIALLELVGLGALWWLLGMNHTGSSTRGRLAAFALFAWNPLVLFDLVGSSHNDVAMLSLLLLGLVPIFHNQRAPGWLTGIAALTLSALVKYLTGVAVVLWTVAWVTQATARRERALRAASSLAVALGLTVVLSVPWLQAFQAFSPLGDAASGRLILNSAPDLVALTVADQILQRAGVDAESAQQAARFWTRAITRALFAVYFGWELWRVWMSARLGPARLLQATLEAATRALLVLPLLVLTWVWSWYFCCSLALAALLAGRSRSDLSRLVVGYTLLAPPVIYAHQYLNQDLSGGWILAFALGPVLMLFAWRWLVATRSRPQPAKLRD